MKVQIRTTEQHCIDTEDPSPKWKYIGKNITVSVEYFSQEESMEHGILRMAEELKAISSKLLT